MKVKVTEVIKSLKALGASDQEIEVRIEKGLGGDDPAYEDDREGGVISDGEFQKVLDRVAAGVKAAVTVPIAKSATAIVDETKRAAESGKVPNEVDELRKLVEVSIEKSEQTQRMLQIYSAGILDLLKLTGTNIGAVGEQQEKAFKNLQVEVQKSLGGVTRQVAAAGTGPRATTTRKAATEASDESPEVTYDDQVAIYKSEVFARIDEESKNPETNGSRRHKLSLAAATLGVPMLTDAGLIKRAAHELGYKDLVDKAPTRRPAVS